LILYHGSNVAVENPIIVKSNRTLDFGNGFYTTTSRDQAYKWARIKQRREETNNGFITNYEVPDDIFNRKDLNIRVFRGASKNWLNFVVNNRMKMDYIHKYDIVKGSVADDRVYACLNAFENRFMDFDMAIKELRTYKLEDQISFHTVKAIKILEFIKCEVR
jgi:hypothetical protein